MEAFIKHRKIKQKGSSLINALIALAISGIVIYNITQMSVMTFKIQRTFEVSNEINEMMGNINQIFSRPSTCLVALGGGQQIWNSADFKIYDPLSSSNPKATLLGKGFRGGWSVKDIKLIFNPIPPPTGNVMGVLEITLFKNSEVTIGPSADKVNKFNLSIDLTGNKITGCTSQSSLQVQVAATSYFTSQYDSTGPSLQVFSGTASCPAGFIAIGCLGCQGVGCTPDFTAADFNTGTNYPNTTTLGYWTHNIFFNRTNATTCSLSYILRFTDSGRDINNSSYVDAQVLKTWGIAPLCIKQ